MSKRYLTTNVFDAAQSRISEVFDGFSKIYVSFSGGKDSTVMLHMVAQEARKRGKKFGLLFIDLEGQYKLTIEHIQRCYDEYADASEPFWCCLPIHLRNAVSTFQPFWKCWDANAKDAWIRNPPTIGITSPEHFPFFKDGMEFEEFVPEFGAWYGQGEPCACFVGIRTDESLNRFRTINSLSKIRWNNKAWTTQVSPGLFNAYPIYDWRVDDLWVWHSRNPKASSNHLYDLMYKAGLTLAQMRICQPYGDDQRRGLWLFHLIEPETWSRIVARVNGANSGALYVQESGNITGYRRVSKPPHLTWQQFARMLLSTMPQQTNQHFEVKIGVFCKWWEERGYPQGIPDEAPYELEANKTAPSWRRIVKALLRNDFWCKGLSFTQHKSNAYEKYLELKKRKLTTWNNNKKNLSPQQSQDLTK